MHVPGGTTHWFRFAKGGGDLFAITSRGNASGMFRAFDKGINWSDPDRSALVALAATYGQTVVPGSLGQPGKAGVSPDNPGGLSVPATGRTER